MLSRGEIPVLMARPINQAFRSGIFADITEQILDGANLYDDNIREQMMKILQENDFQPYFAEEDFPPLVFNDIED